MIAEVINAIPTTIAALLVDISSIIFFISTPSVMIFGGCHFIIYP
jgi:hypothetical protein